MVVNHRGRASAPCITKWICTALGLANLLGSFAQAAMASGCETPNISGKSEINRPKVMCRWALGPSKLTLGHQLWTVSTVDFDGQIWVPGLVNVDSEAWMIIVLSMVVPLKILSILTFQYWWLLLLNKHVYAVLLIFFQYPWSAISFCSDDHPEWHKRNPAYLPDFSTVKERDERSDPSNLVVLPACWGRQRTIQF